NIVAGSSALPSFTDLSRSLASTAFLISPPTESRSAAARRPPQRALPTAVSASTTGSGGAGEGDGAWPAAASDSGRNGAASSDCRNPRRGVFIRSPRHGQRRVYGILVDAHR